MKAALTSAENRLWPSVSRKLTRNIFCLHIFVLSGRRRTKSVSLRGFQLLLSSFRFTFPDHTLSDWLYGEADGCVRKLALPGAGGEWEFRPMNMAIAGQTTGVGE